MIYAVGIAGHIFSPFQSLMKSLTPYVLLVTGSTVLFHIRTNRKLYLLLWCFITYIVTIALEIIGVKTGLIFGNYQYGDVLGITVYGVPIIIGFNWLLIILASINIAQSAENNIFLASLLAATLAVAFDIVLEPVAIKLNYWYWEGNLIPLTNYYSWFAIAFVLSLIAAAMRIELNSVVLEHYYFIQLIFFVILLLLL